MKEYCLVPRRAWEEYSRKIKKNEKKKEEAIPRQQQKNPNLELIINLYVKQNSKDYVRSMLQFLEKSVQWDENGDVMTPFTNINIVDLLNKFSYNAGKLEANLLPNVKLLLQVTAMPLEYIRNRSIRTQLMTSSQEGGGGGRRRWLKY